MYEYLSGVVKIYFCCLFLELRLDTITLVLTAVRITFRGTL
jgi:hypothetical protein